MGFASWRVWRIGKEKAKIPLLVYIIKLLINYLWLVLAFAFASILGAVIDSIVLLIFIVITGFLFYRIDKISGLIFIPYFFYMSYVLVLCTHIYILNN
jgi:translocator protein